MKCWQKYILLISFLSLISNLCYAQNYIDTIESRLQNQVSAKPSELIYLQTSKGIYETGEDLWFKAYQFEVQSFGLSSQSQTLYLQMVNAKDSIIWQEKYPIENGIAAGHVYVDKELQDGDYFLEGYTRHSFYDNDTTAILQARRVKIVNNIAKSTKAEAQKDSTFRFEMFPEGGHLISGVSSRLAFKAADGRGNPISVNGSVYQDDEQIAQIKSTHDGMGVVLFTPTSDKEYRVELDNGRSYPLPEVQSEGMGFYMTKQDHEKVEFVVSQSPSQQDKPFYLIGQMRGMLGCVAQGVVKDKQIKVTIPLDNFPYQGIAEFTLFNASMQSVAERLVYLHPNKKLFITTKADKERYETRDKATLTITVTDEAGNPVRANLGVSVYDQIYSNPADPVNMPSYCYLTSQIRGRIHNPAYYFDAENKNREQAMDLLMLTQGWRRYVWGVNQLATHGQPFLTDEIIGIQTLPNKKKSESYKGSEQLVQVSGAEGNSQFVWADSTGRFVVTPDIMKELRGSYVYLKPMLSSEIKPRIDIATDYFPKLETMRKSIESFYSIVDLSKIDVPFIMDAPRKVNDTTYVLEEVVVMGKSRNAFRDKFMGRLDSLAQMSLGGAWVCGCGGRANGYLNDYMGYSHHPVGCPQMPVKKRSVPVNGKDYELIKYEPVGANGNWIVTDIKVITYNGPEFTEEELLRRNNLYRTKGYYAEREFYQPDEIDMQISAPDMRNTLLWQPNVVTDEKGEATLSFYCSDINNVFRVAVEGVDGAGLVGSNKCEFRVIRK